MIVRFPQASRHYQPSRDCGWLPTVLEGHSGKIQKRRKGALKGLLFGLINIKCAFEYRRMVELQILNAFLIHRKCLNKGVIFKAYSVPSIGGKELRQNDMTIFCKSNKAPIKQLVKHRR